MPATTRLGYKRCREKSDDLARKRKEGDKTPFQQKAKLLNQRQPLSSSLVGVIVPRVQCPSSR